MSIELEERVKLFLGNEARSCSMDIGCVDAYYVQRMIGREYLLEEIKAVLAVAKKELGYGY